MQQNDLLHRPVMEREIVKLLDPKPGLSFLDLTAGTGGHALVVGKHLGTQGLVAAMDADAQALKVALGRFKRELSCEFRIFHGWFSEAGDVLKEVGLNGFNLLLADLGIGSHQLDRERRGFSYDSHEMLDMRFDRSCGLKARDIINDEPQEKLADIFYELGQEKFSRQIAAEICRRRKVENINTCKQLSDIAVKVYASKSSREKTWRIHPATRVFMALRIYINEELEELKKLLELLPYIVAPGAKAAIISYHSLEARLVKQAWKHQSKSGLLSLITKKPVVPAQEEVSVNPRSRSAQLRVAEFTKKVSGKFPFSGKEG